MMKWRKSENSFVQSKKAHKRAAVIKYESKRHHQCKRINADSMRRYIAVNESQAEHKQPVRKINTPVDCSCKSKQDDMQIAATRINA